MMEQNLQLALKRVEDRFAELDRLLAEPDVARASSSGSSF